MHAAWITRFSLVLAMAASTPVLAQWHLDARGWMDRMADAMEDLTYQGTFVYVQGDTVETMRITHVKDENGVRERMYSLSGPLREVIRDADGVRFVLGKQEPIRQSPVTGGALFPSFPDEVLNHKNNSYLLRTGSNDRIAGHIGRRLMVLPRDDYRYGYDIWLEANSGLLLRWVLYDAKRNALAKLMFTDFRFGKDVDLSELQSNVPMEKFKPLESAAPVSTVDSLPKAEHAPQGMPPGFTIAAYSRSRGGQGRAFEHLVFSDGLASVSVYIERVNDSFSLHPGLSRMGTTNAFSTRAGGMNIVAIGEVPALTVKTIGKAFIEPLLASQ